MIFIIFNLCPSRSLLENVQINSLVMHVIHLYVLFKKLSIGLTYQLLWCPLLILVKSFPLEILHYDIWDLLIFCQIKVFFIIWFLFMTLINLFGSFSWNENLILLIFLVDSKDISSITLIIKYSLYLSLHSNWDREY